jgi:hypothetical protein
VLSYAMKTWLKSLDWVCTIVDGGVPSRRLWTKTLCEWFTGKMEAVWLSEHLGCAPNGVAWKEALGQYLSKVRREALYFVEMGETGPGKALLAPIAFWKRVVEWVDGSPEWPLLVPAFWSGFMGMWEQVERGCLEVSEWVRERGYVLMRGCG